MFVFITLSLPLLLWTASTSAQTEPGFFVSAPDVIRIGVPEKILISVHNTGSRYIPVRLLLQSYPDKQITYADQLIEVHQDHPQVVTLQVDPRDVEPKEAKQFTSLVVKSEADHFVFQREKEILLSFKSGYVFIQTDKPIYTPQHVVKIRVISLDQEMKPSHLPIKLEIRNPQNIIVMQKEKVISEMGFITESFLFPPHPLFGNWSVVAFYGHKQQLNTTVKFHVEDYVLPTFSVEVTMANPYQFYILPDGADLPIFIVAKTTFGKPVHGSYYIKYSVIQPGGELHDLNSSESGKLESDGRVIPVLKTSNSDWAIRYLGRRLQIHVSVTEEASGKTESANNTQVMFVNTPYKFKWDNTVKYFKKGLPFEVKVDVKYANGQPGFNVPVNAVTKANTQTSGQIILKQLSDIMPNTAGQFHFRVDVPTDATKITVELDTADAAISNEYNTHASFDVSPQEPAIGGSYLSVQIHEHTIEAGDTVSVELKKTGNPGRNTTLYMFVLSKGQIVDHKTTSSTENTIHVDLPVTFDMIPHARLMAYFIDDNNEVVADSVWFDVMHDCNNDVDITAQEGSIHKPKDEVQFYIGGNPGTQVGLLAIDSSVYLLQDNDKLTKEKVFKEMDGYDLGCGPGGGRDAQAIFMDSGITVITNANLDTDLRQDETCTQASARRKRDVASQLSTQYSDPEQQLFCNMGASEHWMNTTACSVEAHNLATERGLSVDDERIQAFYNCCMMVHQEGEHLTEESEEEAHVRSDFPETWIFDQVQLDNTGSAVYSIATPDSATTWIIQAIGVSSNQGMCVATPIRLRVQPDFFIRLHMPPAVVRHEQVEIVATVSNYLEETLEANVSFLGVDGLCSETSPGEWSGIRQFDIPPGDSVVVKFNVVPLGVGDFPLEIMVTTPRGKDTVKEDLKVVPEGIVRSHIIQIPLNPTSSSHQATDPNQLRTNNRVPLAHENIPTGNNNHQRDHINITLPGGAVPDSASLSVDVTGNLMGRMFPAVIGGHTLVSDVEAPSDNNGELTAADTATNVYVLKYLKETGQLTPNVTSKLHQNIQTGVTTQYTNRKEDSGSFAFMPWAQSSTWLTAFVNKIFCQAREFHFIDPHVTSSAMNWLVTESQQQDGSFLEVFRVHEDNIRGALEDEDLGNNVAAKTAYVLISLLECNYTAVQNHAAVDRATAYLESIFANLVRPFDKAIVTYALTLAGSEYAVDSNERLREIAICSEDTCHWEEDPTSFTYVTRPDHWYAVAIETTGYALLAQLKLGEIEYSHSIVNWLSQNGGFEYTQDTVVALQALSEYAIWRSDQAINLHTTIRSSQDSSFRPTVHINEGNALLQHTIQGPVDGQLIVDTRGKGTGQLAVQIKYNSVDDNNLQNCLFDVQVIAGEGDVPNNLNTTGRVRRSIPRRERRSNRGSFTGYVNVCTRYVGNAQSSNEAVIDVGLYSGFRPIEATLKQILRADSRIQRYEITNRSVIFFVSQIPSTEGLCFTFVTIRDFVVGKIQPVAVRVYNYHEPAKDCVKFYSQTNGPTMIASMCEGQTCKCAEGSCPSRPCEADQCSSSCQELLENIKQRNSTDTRKQSIFAYKVRLVRREVKAAFEVVYMNISAAFVVGDDEALRRSFQENPNRVVVRPFWQSLNCQQRIGRLGSKRTYLVIGSGGMRYVDENGEESFKYMLDETFVFEDWPEGNRATKPRFIPQIEKIDTLRTAIEQGGDCST